MLRQWQEALALFVEERFDRMALGIAGRVTRMCDARDPIVQLLVEVVDGPEAACGKEGVARPLALACSIRGAGGLTRWLETGAPSLCTIVAALIRGI